MVFPCSWICIDGDCLIVVGSVHAKCCGFYRGSRVLLEDRVGLAGGLVVVEVGVPCPFVGLRRVFDLPLISCLLLGVCVVGLVRVVVSLCSICLLNFGIGQ